MVLRENPKINTYSMKQIFVWLLGEINLYEKQISCRSY